MLGNILSFFPLSFFLFSLQKKDQLLSIPCEKKGKGYVHTKESGNFESKPVKAQKAVRTREREQKGTHRAK